jgi:hypothetical protein
MNENIPFQQRGHMENWKIISKLSLAAAMLATTQVQAKTKCPEPVSAAAVKAYPDARISGCKREVDSGKVQFEVKLDSKANGKVELDIDTTGSILLTEQIVPTDSVSQEALTAFKAKYPDAKISRAEKQTKADGSVTYELAFKEKGKKHEATFRGNGDFVELE